jgi:hypothetical protein
MKMRLSNGNPSPAQIANYSQKLATQPIVNTPRSLNGSMISRIHALKPGCGGCGRH